MRQKQTSAVHSHTFFYVRASLACLRKNRRLLLLMLLASLVLIATFWGFRFTRLPEGPDTSFYESRYLVGFNYWFLPSAEVSSQSAYTLVLEIKAALTGGFALLCVALVKLVSQLLSYIVYGGAYRAAQAALDGGELRARLLFPFGLWWKLIVLNILRNIVVGLWSLLLIVPGLIAALRYSMADYLLIQEPTLSPLEALKASKEMTLGFKGELFRLNCWSYLLALPAVALIAIYTFRDWCALPGTTGHLLGIAVLIFELLMHGVVNAVFYPARVLLFRDIMQENLHPSKSYLNFNLKKA